MNIGTRRHHRPLLVRGLASASLCACLFAPAAQGMEVERTDLEPWEPAVEESDTGVTPWTPPVAVEEKGDADTAAGTADDANTTADAVDDGNGEVGYASYYGQRFHGRRTASGHPFDASGSTAAHRTLPLGTEIVITNLANGRSVTATVTDRGPFVRGRIVDVSRALAARLGFIHLGKAKVRVAVRGFSPLDPPPRRLPRRPR